MEPFGLPDRYRLEHGIAAGGMAAVYAAHDTALDRPVAVKVLADHLNDDVVARQRFAREGRAAAALSSHPGVVTIFDVGEHNGRAFMVMERREGGTIADAGEVSTRRALGWLHTAADALDAAHAQGVVHRDIKPANLLLDEQDRVAVADFGIASLAHETERFTQTGQVLGTASYLSPEQATGEAATSASDRYALAVVAYELLTGEKPFTASHFAAQARAHIEDVPPPAAGLPRPAQQVLARGLAKDPAARWPSAAALVDALDEAVGADVAATRTLPPRTAAAKTPPRPAPAAIAAGAPPQRRRGGGRGGLAAVIGLVLIAGVAIALVASGGDDGDAKTADRPATTTTEKQRPKKKATATATPKPSASPSPAPTASPAPTVSQTSDADPSALNTKGFDAIKAGDYAAAVAPLQAAVDACDGGGKLDPCGFAYYNLGVALNRSGRSSDAVPVLQTRLRVWGDNTGGDVQKELDAASGGPTAKPGKGPKPKPPGKEK